MPGVEAGAGGVEPRGDDATVVEDEEIARSQKTREVTEKTVLVGTRFTVENKHPAGAANRRWGLGDQLFGKVEIEVGYEQIRSKMRGNLWCFRW